MKSLPRWKIYDSSGEWMADCAVAYAAALLVAQFSSVWTVKYRGQVVWGKDDHSIDGRDPSAMRAAADLMRKRAGLEPIKRTEAAA